MKAKVSQFIHLSKNKWFYWTIINNKTPTWQLHSRATKKPSDLKGFFCFAFAVYLNVQFCVKLSLIMVLPLSFSIRSNTVPLTSTISL